MRHSIGEFGWGSVINECAATCATTTASAATTIMPLDIMIEGRLIALTVAVAIFKPPYDGSDGYVRSQAGTAVGSVTRGNRQSLAVICTYILPIGTRLDHFALIVNARSAPASRHVPALERLALVSWRPDNGRTDGGGELNTSGTALTRYVGDVIGDRCRGASSHSTATWSCSAEPIIPVLLQAQRP
jgi:hypothetical protein